MLLMTCSICGRQYDSHAVTSHTCPKLYTEAELAAKQVELLRGILEEYKDDHINGNQDKKYSSIIQAKINKLEGE